MFFKQITDEETGAPIWTKTGLGGGKNKAILRTNDGDVRAFDKDNIPDELKDPNGIPGYMWFTKGYFEALNKMYQERVDYDESEEITEPWWSNTGVQKRVARWESLKTPTKFDAPVYTRTFWSQWGDKLRENIDNDWSKDGAKTTTA